MSYRRLEQKCMFANSKTKCPLFSVTSHLHNEQPKPLYASPSLWVHKLYLRGGGVAQWLGRRISDQGVPGLNPGWCTFRCGLEHVTYTLLSTCCTKEAVNGRPTWTDCDEAGDYVVPNVLNPRDLVFRTDNMDETVPHISCISCPFNRKH